VSSQTSILGVLRRNPAFVRLWSAQVVSMAGDWLHRMALLVLIGELAGPDAQLGVGLLYGFEMALHLMPLALFSPLAGPVADRVPRRFLMVAADLMRAVLVLLFLLVDDAADLPLLYTLLFLQMGCSIFFESARSASVPSLVRREDIHGALALSAATWSTMLAVGAALGGVLTNAYGTDVVFIADAVTYLVSAALLIGLALPALPKQPEPFRWWDLLTFADMRRGLDHVRELHLLPAVLTKTFWWPAGGYLVLLSVAGQLRFAPVVGAALATSALYAMRGMGTGLGPVLARRVFGSSDRALRLQIGLGLLVAALFYGAFGQAQNLWWAGGCVLVAHMGGSTVWVASTAWWQQHVDDAYRGRIYALDFLCMTVSFSVGGVLTGLLYDATDSLEITTAVLSACLLVNLAVWWRWSGSMPAAHDDES
jgi:MFS family permease